MRCISRDRTLGVIDRVQYLHQGVGKSAAVQLLCSEPLKDCAVCTFHWPIALRVIGCRMFRRHVMRTEIRLPQSRIQVLSIVRYNGLGVSKGCPNIVFQLIQTLLASGILAYWHSPCESSEAIHDDKEAALLRTVKGLLHLTNIHMDGLHWNVVHGPRQKRRLPIAVRFGLLANRARRESITHAF